MLIRSKTSSVIIMFYYGMRNSAERYKVKVQRKFVGGVQSHNFSKTFSCLFTNVIYTENGRIIDWNIFQAEFLVDTSLNVGMSHKRKTRVGANRVKLNKINILNNRGILVYTICLISISNSVSDGATNISLLNIEKSQYD